MDSKSYGDRLIRQGPHPSLYPRHHLEALGECDGAYVSIFGPWPYRRTYEEAARSTRDELMNSLTAWLEAEQADQLAASLALTMHEMASLGESWLGNPLG